MHSCNNTVSLRVTVHVQTFSFSSSTRSQSFSPLLHYAVDSAMIKTFPLVHDALAKFFNIFNLPLVVNPLLHDSPHRIAVDGVKIRTTGRPQTWWDKIRRNFFQQLDRLASSVALLFCCLQTCKKHVTLTSSLAKYI